MDIRTSLPRAGGVFPCREGTALTGSHARTLIIMLGPLQRSSWSPLEPHSRSLCGFSLAMLDFVHDHSRDHVRGLFPDRPLALNARASLQPFLTLGHGSFIWTWTQQDLSVMGAFRAHFNQGNQNRTC